MFGASSRKAMPGHLEGRAVLITGGTMGIGLVTGLAFGRHGARCTLTYKWGTADEDEIRRRFAEVGAPPPSIVRADVAREEDTTALLEGMRRVHDRVEAFVSNVSVALVNVVRARLVRTESLRATFGAEFEPFAERFNMERQFIPAEEVANTVLALCSGLLDGVSGQVIMVDRGTTFFDNLMRLYNERDALRL